MKESSNSGFDSISPTARSLLLTKALITILFAKEAVKLIWDDHSIKSTQDKLSSIGFLLRIIHFEKRYKSIDQSLKEIGIKNVLEFSSGFSFRGLKMSKDSEICYIDTDLPAIIEKKRILVQELTKRYCNYTTNNLFLNSLNVLDEVAFTRLVNRFPPGPVAFANEGLLIYFDRDQKRKLCQIIRNLLIKRGGYWIAADIYKKNDLQTEKPEDFYDIRGKNFLFKHNVEDNKFENFEDAEVFFKNCGFEIYKKTEASRKEISSLRLLRRFSSQEIEEIKKRKKTRETWILKVKN